MPYISIPKSISMPDLAWRINEILFHEKIKKKMFAREWLDLINSIKEKLSHLPEPIRATGKAISDALVWLGYEGIPPTYLLVL